MYDFDKIVNRENTFSVKWDGRQEVFGTSNVFPLWVADMDFEAPECVVEAMKQRTDHRVFGYSLHADSYFQAFIQWVSSHQQWHVEREWCFFSPGIVPALGVAVQAFTKEWEKVLVQTPVYNPFFNVVEGNRRELVYSPLIIDNGIYKMDFDSLEEEFKNGVKLMLLCNPHNPGGRVWTRDELLQLAELSLKYKVVVFSDEIHGDLVFETSKHIPYASLGEKFLPFSAVCQAPSKTFNIAGLSSSVVVIPNEELKQKMKTLMETLHLCSGNIFGTIAFKTAYTKCSEWHEALIKYLNANRVFILEYFKENMPELKVMVPQAGFLIWIDFREMGLNDKMLNEFIVTQAGLGLSSGVIYGAEGSGFMRLNFGLNRKQLHECLDKLSTAVRSFFD